MNEENPTTIGYGSLFLPTSVMRVDPSVGQVKPKYEEEKRYGDGDILRRSAVESWAWREKAAREGEENGVRMIPVKVDGFRRKYNLETDYGGAMLDVEEDEDSWMNAVVISGLSEEEKEELDSSEEAYGTATLEREEVEPYVDEDAEILDEEFEDGNVEIYIGKPKTTNRSRNQTYHDRIRTGIDMIGEFYEEAYTDVNGKELAKEIWEDFQETTYEKWHLEPQTSSGTEEELEEDIWTNTGRNDEIESIAEMHGYDI